MFKKWDKTTPDGELYYDIQTALLREALCPEGCYSLNKLLCLMREKVKEGYESTSSIYLCGTRIDSECCFGSDDLGLALSVLPEDGEKAAEPGYHPGSTEVYVTFQGSLIIELLDRGVIGRKTLGQFDVLVIPPGQCHRVRNEPEQKAASLIVKTNSHYEPKALRCEKCTYYKDSKDCPLYRSWDEEKKTLHISND